MKVSVVVPGPDGHGVVRHARDVACLLQAASSSVQVEIVRDLRPFTGGDITHTHFTDALFGCDIVSAAAHFVEWSQQAPRPLVVTLHDVPGGGADPDHVRDRRRLAGYAQVARAADAVIVSGQHEVVGGRSGGTEPWVIPLPVPAPGSTGSVRPETDDPATVAVLGFVYPGKGHDLAVEAVAGLDPQPRVIALGAASPGHEGLVEALHAQAHRQGVELQVTGPLTQEELFAAMRTATVPLAAYSTLGSSGSLATWLAAGRRPLTTTTPHTRELLAAGANCLRLLSPQAGAADLARAVAQALAEPESTWLDRPVARPDTAGAHLEVFRAAVAARAHAAQR